MIPQADSQGPDQTETGQMCSLIRALAVCKCPKSFFLIEQLLYLAASHLDEEESESGDSNIPADRKPKKTSILDKITAQTIKQILELLCDESVSRFTIFYLISLSCLP